MLKTRNTKQQEIVLNYLIKNKEKHVTAEDILFGLKNNNVSQATIYRILSKLVLDGKVRKYIANEHNKSCYQYVENVQKCNNHFHIVCDKCGTTFHFEDKSINKIKENIYAKNGFEVNLQKVVFYGICKKCKENL